MFKVASGPSLRTGRAWRRRIRGGGTKDPIVFVLVLMAATSLGMGVLGGIALLKLRNGATDQPQPYVATEADRDAEKSAQRSSLIRIIREIAPQTLPREKLTAAKADPNYLEKRAASPEKKTPSAERPIRQRKSKPGVARPSGASAPSASEQAQALSFLNYLADQIAGMHVDLRNMSSRVAVAERSLRQLQDKGWFEWLALGVTLAGIIQGLLGAAVAILKWRQAKSAPATA